MILLPDIRLTLERELHTLSIQEPFLLDGYIITDIQLEEIGMSYQTSLNGTIVLKNEDCFCVRLDLRELEYLFKREMDRFIARYGYDVHVEGRRDMYDWFNYSLNLYLSDIKEQCERIFNRYTYGMNDHYLSRLREELRRQRREYRNPIMNNCITWDDWLGSPTISTEIRDFWGEWGRHNTSIASNQAVRLEDTRKYIHEYNYKPKFIHHYMPEENQDTTLLLGCEIEVAGNTNTDLNKEDVVKKCIQIMNGSEDDTESLIYSTHDGTVQIELDSMPCSFEFHKNKMNYKELFKYLNKLGYKGHDVDCAGLHIHADRKYLGKSELVQQLTISKILYILEKFNDEICVIARRNNSDYSKFVGKNEVDESLDKLYGKYKNEGKRAALNLQHKESIEFRMFRSTLKYETFILTLEFVKDVIDFAKSVNIETIELIKWDDLMNTFSDELKVYYQERLEKENKKKKTIKEETKVAANISWNLNNRSSITSIISPNAVRRFNSDTIYIIDDHVLDSEGYIPFSLQLSEPAQVEKTTLENLKDTEKTLKKRIKYSNNPLEKKNLEKELKEVQKELKKEKKRLKNNSEN